MSYRIVTWNLQGRERPDLAAVADALADRSPDVVLLQEVQRRQAGALARRLGWSVAWRFKHWPLIIRAEGLAILSPRSVSRVRVVHLARRWAFWSSERRIAVAAEVDGLGVVDVHLGAGIEDAERVRQAHRSLSVVPDGPVVVAGDLNARPGSPVLEVYAGAEMQDAWAAVGDGPGETNWSGPREGPPTKRLDYVYVGPGLVPVAASLPTDAGTFAPLSDHLPLTVTVDRG